MTNPSNNHKYGAVTVYCDPLNYLSYRTERDDIHKLRFPSKFEYYVYCSLRKYIDRLNRTYGKPRYFLELQYQIKLVEKTGVMKSPISHVVDFVIRDDEASINPVLYIEAKGKFLPEYVSKMTLLAGFKPNVHRRYLVVSNNTPPKGYSAHFTKMDTLEKALNVLGVR